MPCAPFFLEKFTTFYNIIITLSPFSPAVFDEPYDKKCSCGGVGVRCRGGALMFGHVQVRKNDLLRLEGREGARTPNGWNCNVFFKCSHWDHSFCDFQSSPCDDDDDVVEDEDEIADGEDQARAQPKDSNDVFLCSIQPDRTAKIDIQWQRRRCRHRWMPNSSNKVDGQFKLRLGPPCKTHPPLSCQMSQMFWTRII